MAIRIDFLSNTRAAVEGVKDYGDALEKVSPALDDVARDGARSAERLERSFKEASDETADAAREASKDIARAYASGTRSAADDMARNSADGTSKAKADLAELGNEARQNAAETFSSFDGSAASFADGIQGTLGGVVSSLGPIGAAAGAAGALGIGLVMTALDKSAERTQQLREYTAELAQEYIDTGEVGEASLEFVIDRLKELATETDDAAVSLEDLRDVSDKSGGSFKDLAQAYSGNTDDLDKLIRKTRDQKDALEASNKAAQDGLAYRDRVGGDDPRIASTQKYIDYLEEAKTAAADAAEQQRNFAEAGGPEMERKAELVEALNEAYDDGAGEVDDYINAESNLFDVEAYLAAMTAKQQALIDYQETLATASLTPEAKAFITSQGIDSAATFLAGYKTATPAQQAELNRIWSEAGATSSGAFSDSVQADLDQAGYKGTVKLTADMTDVERAIARVSNVGINMALKLTTPNTTRVP